MKKNHCDIKYTVGFTFDPNVNATLLQGSATGNNILINPTKVKQYSDAIGLGHWLFQKACHEITHFCIENHNENFSIRWGSLMEDMGNNPRKWSGIFNKAKQEAAIIIKKNRA